MKQMSWKIRKRVLESPGKSWTFNNFFLWQPCHQRRLERSNVTVLIYAYTHYYMDTYILIHCLGKILELWFFRCDNKTIQDIQITSWECFYCCSCSYYLRASWYAEQQKLSCIKIWAHKNMWVATRITLRLALPSVSIFVSLFVKAPPVLNCPYSMLLKKKSESYISNRLNYFL